MSWRDRLTKASFQDTEFLTEDFSISGGWRVAVHEYPFQDSPYPENMGPKAEEFSVNAYFIGQNYDQQAEAFHGLLISQPEGELNHPLLGVANVHLLTWQRSETTAEGGICRYQLKFVRSGSQRFPATSRNIHAEVQDAVDAVWVGLDKGAWDELVILQQQPGGLLKILEYRAALNSIFRVVSDLVAIINPVVELMGLIADIRQIISLVGGDERWSLLYRDIESDARQQELDGLIRTAAQRHEALQKLFLQDPESPLFRYAAYGNLTELARLVAIKKYESAEQAYAQLDSLMASMEPLRDLATHELFSAWRSLTVIITEAVKQQALILPHVHHVVIDKTTPALLLAHKLYGDASRESDIVTRNKIAHSGFIEGEIEVLVE